MKENCKKHPNNFKRYLPEEFADRFVKTNYFYQQKVFEELSKRYRRESEGDYERDSLKNSNKKRVQLASSLEETSRNIEKYVLPSMNKVCNACKDYMKNPFIN
jgi:hypothetical protein